MIYGTNHDSLNGHGQGLALEPTYISRAPRRPRSLFGLSGLGAAFGTLSSGIDQNGQAYVQANNQYFYDSTSLFNFAQNAVTPETKYINAAFSLLNGSGVYGYSQNFYKSIPMAVIVEKLKDNWSVPFTAYVPPVAPVASPIVAPPAIPAGFQVLTIDWIKSFTTYPIYGVPPQLQPGGNFFDFSGAQGFYSFFPGVITTAGIVLQPGQANSIGLDPTKLEAGLYAYSLVDAGPIQSSAGRTYELSILTIFDMVTQQTYGTFFVTTEGGGAGLFITQIAPDILSFVATVATGGINQIVSAVNQKIGRDINNVVGGAVIAGTAAVLSAGLLVPVVAAPIVISAGVEGATIGATAPTAADIVEASTGAGVVTGLVGGAIQAANTPSPISDAINAPASPASPGDSSILTGDESITVPSNVGTAADGSTIPVSPTSDFGTPLGTGAGTTSPIVQTVQTGASAVEKAVGATIVSTGVTALSTEIKKLTGQLPKAAQAQLPSQLPMSVAAPVAASSSTLKYVLGGAAALLLLTKKH